MVKPSETFALQDLELALEGARTGLWAWDVDQRRMLWSSNIVTLFGQDPEQFDGSYESYRACIHEDDVVLHDQAIAAAFEESDGLYSIEHRVRWADGSTHWVEARGKVFRDPRGEARRVTGTVVDITDRKQTEDALRASEKKFSTIVRSSPDAIVLSEAATGRILEVNRGFTRLMGCRREEAIGATGEVLGLWPSPSDRERLLEALEVHQRVHNIEWHYSTPRGEKRWCLFSAELIELAGESLMLSVLRDVTDRKSLEHERQSLIAELEATNAELERFVYSVSHDLKSPLVTVFGFLGLLEKDLAKGRVDRLKGDLAKIRSGAEVMQSLIEELLELSRLGRFELHKEPLDLADIVERVTSSLAGYLEQERVELEVADDLPEILGDRGRVLSLFQNLVDNAAKFMGEQTSPRIEIGSRHGAPSTFYVRDNGQGISSEHQSEIFEPFERLGSAEPGTGLGLTLVRRIVEGHGGTIWVESEGDGKGTTFCFTLAEAQDSHD